jgi:hypothetical protein
MSASASVSASAVGGSVRAGRRSEGAQGFASLDALVALTVLAAGVGLTMQAAGAAHRVAAAALEIQRATALLQALGSAPAATGVQSGRTGPFAWTVTTEFAAAASGAPELRLCRRAIRLAVRPSGRSYGLDGLAFCPRPEPGPAGAS